MLTIKEIGKLQQDELTNIIYRREKRRKKEVIPRRLGFSSPLLASLLGHPISTGNSCLRGTGDNCLQPMPEILFLVSFCFFNVFFEVVKRQ
jgi:hypothetical protein